MDRVYRVKQDGDIFHAVERDGELKRAAGDLFAGLAIGAPVRGGLTSVTLLSPVTPSKIVCVGLNYKDHAAEQGKPLPADPLIFIKPSTAVIGPGDPILLPPGVGRVDYEAELGVVIGRRAHRVKKTQAWEHIAGLICVNDVTTADLIFSIEYIVEFITFVMTLEPGDIIATGTPAGIGPLANGDTVTVKVEGVGELTNPVRNE